MKRIHFLFHLLFITCMYAAGITTATAQTLELLPVNTFFSGSQAQNFFKRSDGSYFFFASDGANGLQLWKTDGTPAGTVQLQAPAPYTAGLPAAPSPTYTDGKDWLLVNNELYFVVDNKYLFCSNGSNSLQLLATAPNTISELTAAGNMVYFKHVAGNNASAVVGLWKTDGTVAGTVQVSTFNGAVLPEHRLKLLTNVNGTLFFQANTENGAGYELYKSDGTAAGTMMVQDIYTTDISSVHIAELTAVGRYLYFRARRTSADKRQWWRSDGTVAGTVQLTHYNDFTNDAGSTPIIDGDTLYIEMAYGSSANKRQIWKLTPDPANPDSLFYQAQVNQVQLLQLLNGKIFFRDYAVIPTSTARTYVCSTTSRTDTTLLHTGVSINQFDDGAYFHSLNGYYLYVARTGITTAPRFSIWRTDATLAGTSLIADQIVRSINGSIKVGNAIYFRGIVATGTSTAPFNTWISDGTTAGTKKVVQRTFTNQVTAFGTDGTYYYFTSTDSVWATNGDSAINLPIGSAATISGLRPTGIYPTANKLLVTAKLNLAGISNANLDVFTGDFAFSTAPQPQTISFADLTKTYGDADVAAGATATSGLDITYSIADPTIAAITNGTLHILRSGTTTITASQPGNGTNWLPAADVTITLTINKAALTITADDKTKTEGDPNPALTLSYSGFVNGETETILTTAPTVTTTAAQSSAAGTYPITASGAAAENYAITYVNGTLTINPTTRQPQTITFTNITKTYGDADFAPGATATSGLTVNYTSDNPAVAVIVSNKIQIVGAGTANITASQPGNGSWLPATDVTSLLTVNKATLNIRAEDKSRLQGESNPSLSVSYTGFVNGETFTALATPPVITTTATLNSAPGIYPVTVSGATADNYDITYTQGTLTVKALPVSADRCDAVFSGNTLQVTVYSSKVQKAMLQLVDATGRVLLTQEASLVNGVITYHLPAFNIARGAYIVLVRGEGLKISDKIIK